MEGSNIMMKIDPKYAVPILTLANALSEYNIPHSLNVLWDGLQIQFPWSGGDIVCHHGSYKSNLGKVESMGCPWDDEDVSVLSIDDAFNYIIEWYSRKKD